MSNSLFSLLRQMEGADIARNLVPFLLNNEHSLALPCDEQILEEVFSDYLVSSTKIANGINALAIELVKECLELSVVDFNNKDHIKEIIAYEENYDRNDASKSIFSISVLGRRWNAPNEDDLCEIIDVIQSYETTYLNNGLHPYKTLFIYLDEKTLSKVGSIDPNILALPFEYDAKLSYLVSAFNNFKWREIINIIIESNPERFKYVSLETYTFLVLCKIH